MCGFLGTVNIPFDQDNLDLIAHRGPDASGLMDCAVGGYTIRLGHRRLSIVDLSSAGSQPMTTSSGRYSIVFNGEIYNHLDLRSALKSVQFRGHSDTESILNVIASSGIETVREFNGIYALALIDKVAGKLYLVRDSFGVKPVYYRIDDSRCMFGSELRSLLGLLDDEVDVTNLAELLQLRYSPSPKTLYANIRKVRPGHIVEIDLTGDKLTHREYPYVSNCPQEIDISFEDALEEYQGLFEASIERQLMSDVEVGVLLSGGIDSALVAAEAQAKVSYPMKAFTVGFSESDYADEISEAAETARILGLEHHCIRISYEDFFDQLRKCVEIVEEPLATTSIIPMYYLASLAARDVKVVLSGQGADESLGGYGRYQAEIYSRFFPTCLVRVAHRFVSLVGIKQDQILRGLYALGESDEVARFVRTYSVFTREEVRKLTGHESSNVDHVLNYYRNVLGTGRQSTSAARMMSLDLRMNLSDDLLLYTDKITMRHSLECRVPMLDQQLVRFVESLPVEYRLRLGDGKRIHKAYAKRRLPRALIERPKKGFLSPTGKWFRQDGLLKDILLQGDSRFAQYIDTKTVAEVLNQHEQGFNRERHIFLLLALFYWFEALA